MFFFFLGYIVLSQKFKQILISGMEFLQGTYSYSTATMFNNDREQDLEMKSKHLQSLDESTIVKTTQFDEDDIIDCMDINRQPSLYHPLLKNHKVQRRPSVLPSEILQSSFPIEHTQEYESGFSRKEDCPDGTVPIYRTTKVQVENAKNISRQMFHNIGRRSTNSLSTNPDSHAIFLIKSYCLRGSQQVFLKVNETNRVRFYGAAGSGSVYELNVGPGQSSSTNIWIETGPPGPVNMLLAGWMGRVDFDKEDLNLDQDISEVNASRSINGDLYPRLFIYWSVDGGEKTGCYNLLCKGFIQVHPRIGPKSRIIPVSTIGGRTFEMKLLIYQDPMTGNWWLVISTRNEMLGYWPKELVPRLAKAATDVAWGGISLAGKDGISPPIGSGRYPDGFYDRAAFFRDIKYLRKGLKQVAPSDQDDVVEGVDKSGCYGLQNDKLTRSDYWGYRFAFGGPGGSTCKH
ncbi:hypothetical protein L484_018563 [Morus notabilis]|uniref:Neprosin PEP catalytic domain-containing protein n=1 Tax=Morus notabilis TaxID=981085 RepID=W9QP71_9ROSA|nr:hypothetical protein L484_018563 [Morus notabilis]